MKLSEEQNIQSDSGLIFDIQDFSVQDGPGIRTTVFFKGCPLKCKWCSNPEGQRSVPEVMHFKTLCKKSYRCKEKCPNGAIDLICEGFPELNRNICNHCNTFDCISTCFSRALKISGSNKSVNEIISRLQSNYAFYKNTGGGITLSGGEPFQQPLFAEKLLRECKALGITAGAETCGYFNWNSVSSFIQDFDFIYFDLKVMNEDVHKSMTGKSNKTILSNLKKLSSLMPDKIIITVAVIPDVNNKINALYDIVSFCKSIGIKNIRILPYHSYGREKYSALGRKYEMVNYKGIEPQELSLFKEMIISNEMELENL